MIFHPDRGGGMPHLVRIWQAFAIEPMRSESDTSGMPKTEHPKRIAVYARRKDLVIYAWHKTDAGFWMAGLPAIQLSADATATELSGIIRDVLARSGTTVPTPRRDDYPRRLKPVLDAVGAKSWSEIERNSRLCTVSQDKPSEIRIMPSRNGGGRGPDRGFHDLHSLAFTIPADAFDEVLAAGVRRGLDLSEAKSSKPK